MLKRIISTFLSVIFVAGMFTGTLMTVSADDIVPFTDVDRTKWFYDAVKYVYSFGIMDGTSEVSFEPATEVTRAMFITVLGRLYGAETVETDIFTDVKEDSWYSGYVGWANTAGIIKGFPDGTFRPDDVLTREQMAVTISRFVDYIGVFPGIDPNAPTLFKDFGKVDDWAKRSVTDVKLYGIVKGDTEGNFRPKDTLTRAEAATTIQRLHEKIEQRKKEMIDPFRYRVESEDFLLMGADHLQLETDAVSSGYTGTVVKDGVIPTLAGDTSQIPYYKDRDRNDPITAHSFFGVDFNVLGFDMNDLFRYAVIRIGFKTEDMTYVRTALNGVEISRVSYGDEEKLDSYRYVTFDLTTDMLGGLLPFGRDDKNVISVENGDFPYEIELAYVAMFKSSDDAEKFNITDYTEHLADLTDISASEK